MGEGTPILSRGTPLSPQKGLWTSDWGTPPPQIGPDLGTPPPPADKQDTCENISFPRTSYVGGKNFFLHWCKMASTQWKPCYSLKNIV